MCALQRLLAATIFVLAGTGAWGHSEGPLGRTKHDWHPDPAIKSAISLNFDFHAGANVVSWSPAARNVTREGRNCIAGAYILFDVDERFAFDTDETMRVDLTFYRPETDGFVLSYDQAVKPTAKEVRFTAKRGDELWHTETVLLERARFANRKYYGSDLAVAGIGSQLERPEGSGEVVLCDLKLSREAGTRPKPAKKGNFKLRIVDENGKPTAARVGLYRADGWAPLASKDAITIQRYTENIRELPMSSVPKKWSAKGRYAFFVNAAYQTRIPAGSYELFVMKGPEYRTQKHSLTVKAGGQQSLEIALQRWDNLPARGWISGDDHIHIARSTPKQNAAVLSFMQAADLHVANLLEAGNLLVGHSHFKQYAYGDEGVYGRDGYFLVSGQESPRTAHRGHSIGLNGKRFYWPERDYFFYDTTSNLIHADGGLWGYAHVAIDAFNLHNGLALDIPRGKVDFLEMLQFGMMNTAYLYDFLNLGFKLAPSAGSDYPYIDFPGSERQYVQLDGPLTAKAWFAAMKFGRSFVTNWMSIDYSVNGDHRAVEYDVRSGEKIAVEAVVKVNPDFDQIDRVELVGHGKVLETVSAEEGMAELKLSHSFAPATSLWLALRAYGKKGALLHTAPIYVYVDGHKSFADRSQVVTIAKKYLEVLTAFRKSTPKLDADFERFAINDLILPRWQEAKPQLEAAIDEASAIYEALMQTGQ